MCGRLSFLDPDGRCSAAWPPRAARPIPQPSAPGRNLTPLALPALPAPSDPPQLHPNTSPLAYLRLILPSLPTILHHHPRSCSPYPSSSTLDNPTPDKISATGRLTLAPHHTPPRPAPPRPSRVIPTIAVITRPGCRDAPVISKKNISLTENGPAGGGPFRRIRRINHVHHRAEDTGRWFEPRRRPKPAVVHK